jgi:toxin ParE1/3/4
MAALTVRWTRQAIADIDRIYDYVVANNPGAARWLVDRIDQAITTLTRHPKIGRAGRVAGSRELVVSGTPYIVAYRLHGKAIELLGVIHAARRWPDKF